MENTDKKQTLHIENRQKMEVDSVINIKSFSDEYLELSTKLGELSVEGKNLTIEDLCHENGRIRIFGEIDGVYYRNQKAEKSFFGKIFK